MTQPGDRSRDRRTEWRSDPKLRALTEMILAMPVEERLRQIEADANFFLSVRPIDHRPEDDGAE